MLRYKLFAQPPKWPIPNWKPEEVIIVLAANKLDSVAKLEFEGDPHLLMLVKDTLFSVSGEAGHGIEEWTTPRDLSIAMQQTRMKYYRPELIEGAEVFERPGR